MSYTVLARRYRSTTFDEVIGQEHVAQTLKKAIAADRIAHAYLFTGTRGVGKTSMARILAKALNCHAFDKATETPCNQCDSCQRIARGDDMDVIEIDAASNTGVDNVRDIIENAQYRPARSRYKVYIIDEVHMLSKAAFNALLKTMEEPPGHVKFILATTEVEKVLPTILSRCQRYDFRNIPTREIAGHLKEICAQEKIDAHEDALFLVAKAGAGSMRDALSLLDRLLSIGEKELTTELIESMLGLPRSQMLFDLAQAIGDGDVKSALTRATAMINGGQSVDSLIAALTEHLRNLMILRTCGADSELVEVPGLALKDLVAQSERYDPAALVQDIAILEELRRHVRQSQAGRALFDATIVRMALSEQFAAIGQLVARIDEGAGGSSGRPPAGSPRPTPAAPARPAPPAEQKKKADEVTAPAAAVASAPVRPLPAAAAVTTPAVAPQPAPSVPQPAPSSPPAMSPSAPTPAAAVSATPTVSASSSVPVPTASVLDSIDFGDDDLPRPGKVWDDSGPSLAELVKSGGVAPAGSTPETASVSSDTAPPPSTSTSVDTAAAWATMLDSLKSQNGVYGVISQARLGRIVDDVAVIHFPPSCETFARLWERGPKKDAVREALSAALAMPIGVRFEVDSTAAAADATPATPAGPASGGNKPAPPRGGPPRPAAPPPRPQPSAPPAQRLTQEQVDAVKSASPLVNTLAAKFNAQIVKIESE